MKKFNKLTEKQMQNVNGGIVPVVLAIMAVTTAGVIGGAAGGAAAANKSKFIKRFTY